MFHVEHLRRGVRDTFHVEHLEACRDGNVPRGTFVTVAWSRPEAAGRLAAALAELSLDPPPEANETLLDLCELLAAWAVRISLTAHRSADAILDRLVADALSIAALLPDAPSLVDLGSGAGFPGIPIAILRPHCRVILVEARERKHHFQREAVRRLRLQNVRLLLGRAEVLPVEPQAIVVAQAMGAPSEILPLLRRWAAPGATLVIPGGERAPQPFNGDSLERVEVAHYRTPISNLFRTLWIGRTPAGEG